MPSFSSTPLKGWGSPEISAPSLGETTGLPPALSAAHRLAVGPTIPTPFPGSSGHLRTESKLPGKKKNNQVEETEVKTRLGDGGPVNCACTVRRLRKLECPVALLSIVNTQFLNDATVT